VGFVGPRPATAAAEQAGEYLIRVDCILSLTACFSWVLPTSERTPTASAVFVSEEENPESFRGCDDAVRQHLAKAERQ